MERVLLRFRFRGTEELLDLEEDTGAQYFTRAIEFTVTNEGKRPLSIERFACGLHIDRNIGRPKAEESVHFPPVVLAQGEAHSAWITLPALQKGLTTARFSSASVLDTTGKVRKPTKAELTQVRSQEAKIWPPAKKTK